MEFKSRWTITENATGLIYALVRIFTWRLLFFFFLVVRRYFVIPTNSWNEKCWNRRNWETIPMLPLYMHSANIIYRQCCCCLFFQIKGIPTLFIKIYFINVGQLLFWHFHRNHMRCEYIFNLNNMLQQSTFNNGFHYILIWSTVNPLCPDSFWSYA